MDPWQMRRQLGVLVRRETPAHAAKSCLLLRSRRLDFSERREPIDPKEMEMKRTKN
jgi:hypothetical protein